MSACFGKERAYLGVPLATGMASSCWHRSLPWCLFSLYQAKSQPTSYGPPLKCLGSRVVMELGLRIWHLYCGIRPDLAGNIHILPSHCSYGRLYSSFSSDHWINERSVRGFSSFSKFLFSSQVDSFALKFDFCSIGQAWMDVEARECNYFIYIKHSLP